MTYAPAQYTGNGVNRTFTVPFEYAQKSDVKVSVEGVDVLFTWLNDSEVRADVAPANLAAVSVYRDTEIDAPIAVFQPGPIRHGDINNGLSQLRLKLQEEGHAGTLVSDYADAAEAAQEAAEDARDAAVAALADVTADVADLVAADAAQDILITALQGDVSDLESAVAAIVIPAGQREGLTGNRTYYVRTDGNNANNGLANNSGGAWATLQYAYNWIVANIDCRGFKATIQMGAGTYSAGLAVFGPNNGGPAESASGIETIGDTTTPSNVVISTTSEPCVRATYGARVIISGIKFVSTGSDALYASAGGIISVPGKVEFGACGGYHMHANANGSTVVSAASYSISGGAGAHYYADKESLVEVSATAVTITNTPAFSLAFALSNDGYLIHAGCTFTGSATGKRYLAIDGGTIDSGSSSLTYFPGNAAGTVSQGGRYVNETTFLESEVLSVSGVSLTSGAGKTVTSLTLTPGTWDVSGLLAFNPNSATVVTALLGGLNTTTDSLPGLPNSGGRADWFGNLTGGTVPTLPVRRRYVVTTTTTIYLVAYASFTTNTLAAYCYMAARRVSE